jgi:NADP-dependent 3-hydroxy acid dehydrogenase YdfG
MMDLIILNDGLYQLIPVTDKLLEGIELVTKVNCFDLCDILRLKLTGYVDKLNLHIMNDGSGSMIGCMCR